jgi:hypothetical protein
MRPFAVVWLLAIATALTGINILFGLGWMLLCLGCILTLTSFAMYYYSPDNPENKRKD